MAYGQVKNVESKAEFDAEIGGGGVVVVHFWAAWCEPCKHMDVIFTQLAAETPHAKFLRVEAEEQGQIVEPLEVSHVPYFIIFKNREVADKLEGANPPELASKVSKLAGPTPGPVAFPANLGLSAGPMVLEAVQELVRANGKIDANNRKGEKESELTETVRAEIQSLLGSKRVFLFMKGTPDSPRCGFSRKVVDALKEEGVQFGTFNILSNESVRQGLKVYSNWPTFPQLYMKGELIGGSDIVLEMHQNGELKTLFAESGVIENASNASVSADRGHESLSEVHSQDDKPQTTEYLQDLINSKPVMLFMKGNPEEPRCGFSRKVVDALKDIGIDFGSFDILSNEEVRQGLKALSNWPTYPQLYMKGELLGGCDIVLEMHQSGELKQTFAENGLLPPPSLEDRLKKLISSSKTMLFMKGTPDEPRCGFSNKVVAALRETGVEFGSFNILKDEEVRDGLKTYSNWPTFPQLYHKGELLGGCDIILEMKASGELKEALTA